MLYIKQHSERSLLLALETEFTKLLCDSADAEITADWFLKTADSVDQTQTSLAVITQVFFFHSLSLNVSIHAQVTMCPARNMLTGYRGGLQFR